MANKQNMLSLTRTRLIKVFVIHNWPIGLRKLTKYIRQYTTAGTLLSQQNKQTSAQANLQYHNLNSLPIQNMYYQK